jgi:hypothetical protein
MLTDTSLENNVKNEPASRWTSETQMTKTTTCQFCHDAPADTTLDVLNGGTRHVCHECFVLMSRILAQPASPR